MQWLNLLVFTIAICSTESVTTEEMASEQLLRLNRDFLEDCYKLTSAEFLYFSNANERTIGHFHDAIQNVINNNRNRMDFILKKNWHNFDNESLNRQVLLFTHLGENALPDDKLRELNNIISLMTDVYENAEVSSYLGSKYFPISKDESIRNALATTEDPEEMKHIWTHFRSSFGKKMKPIFAEYVNLMLTAAKINKLHDAKEMWNFEFDRYNLEAQTKLVFTELKRFYLLLHAYLRGMFMKQFKKDISPSGPIPIHLLRSISGENLRLSSREAYPFPQEHSSHVSTPGNRVIFKQAEKYFVSMGFPPMSKQFWENSIFEKPRDQRRIMCDPSSWNFHDGEDYRVISCNPIKKPYLLSAHKLLAQIYYFMSYNDLPKILQHPGHLFLDAVGNAFSLAAESDDYLQDIGYYKSSINDSEIINFLFEKAVADIFPMPQILALDIWRGAIFETKLKVENYNCKYWEILLELAGLEPPVHRSEQDFDCGGNFFVISSIPHINSFVEVIIRYNVFRLLCIKAGEFNPSAPYDKPLHRCNLYGSTKAAAFLKNSMKLGRSTSWEEVLFTMCSSKTLDGSGVLDYYLPLIDWLSSKCGKETYYIGWGQPRNTCTKQM